MLVVHRKACDDTQPKETSTFKTYFIKIKHGVTKMVSQTSNKITITYNQLRISSTNRKRMAQLLSWFALFSADFEALSAM